MASLDKPRHGWEGFSNGGEIWGNGVTGSHSVDDSYYLEADPSSIRKILDEMDLNIGNDFDMDGRRDFLLIFSDKKQKMIDTLNNHFGIYNELPEIKNVTDEDFKRIIALYEEEASKNGRDPWNYLYFDDLIIMQKCVYEIIKNNSSYYSLMIKLEGLYELELNRRLKRVDYSRDVEYQAPYSEMPDYSMVLADMCCRQMEETQKQAISSNEVSFPEHSLATYKAIKSDLEKVNLVMSDKNEEIAESTETLMVSRKIEDEAIAEQQRLEENEKLLDLERDVLRIEGELLKIKERIRMISSETLGTYFDEWVATRYPEEYSAFLKQKEQLKGSNSNHMQVSDLKARFEAASSELKLYKSALPVYEGVYQRYNEMMKEDKKSYANEKELERIYNLIFSEENERLRQSNSLYTAWELSDKVIPFRYRGKTYEEVAEMLLAEKEQQRLSKEAYERRESLINKAVRKEVGVDENFRLTDVQINNLRKKFDPYTDEELYSFLSGEELGVKPKTPIIFDGDRRVLTPMKDYGGELEKITLIGEIIDLMFPDRIDDILSAKEREKLNLNSVEELRVIKSEWQQASLSSNNRRAM